MRAIESNCAGAPMSEYLDQLMPESGPTGEELASLLECTVDELYELLQGTRDITPADIEALEKKYAEATSSFVVGCQMMSVISNRGDRQ